MKVLLAALTLGPLLSVAQAQELRLENPAIEWRAEVAHGRLRPVEAGDRLNDTKLALSGEDFELVLGNGTVLKSSDFALEETPVIEPIKPEPASPTLSRHFAGRQLAARLTAPNQHLDADWRVILRDGPGYVRQQLTLRAVDRDVLVKEIVLFDQKVPGAMTVGVVAGSPVVAGNFFLGYEQPMAQNTVDSNGVVRCSFVRNAVLQPGESLDQSCVIGVVRTGQLRRDFLAYLERERARPYRPFLHYNSWYDLRHYTESQCVNAINGVGQELTVKRGVRIASFLFDDGWDDPRTLWQFHSGLPHGFAPLRAAAQKYHSSLGVWISPFGGYDEPKRLRLEFGSAQGFETNATGFSLAGPKYYQRFHELCAEMIQQYGVNAFKFDGLAAGARAGEAGLTRDGDAMLRMIGELRAIRPDLYINQTTGTWPSPFWLLSVDSTWRGGSDHSFYGPGSARQRWITFRDLTTYRNVVQRAPLYPLNSLMVHGILYARYANNLATADDQDFADEVREYFGTGTQLQELYLTPALLDRRNWDDLAEAAKWSQANADVLVDTHWVGGDPGQGEIYGWASWSPRKGILTLRNPGDQPRTFTADVKDLFQLPSGAKSRYRLHSPWKQDRREAFMELRAGEPHTFALPPFAVLVLETQ
ncbi:MAG: enterotoxin [Verrucomicrobiota bacterium]|jgi:hypothetical protein